MSEDLVHAPGAERRWRESYYVSFFDPVHRIGGFSSIGKRPATGHSGFINVIWGPQLPTLVSSEYDTFTTWDNNHEIAGMTYAAQEPFGRWRVTFDGRLNNGGTGAECDHQALGPATENTIPVRYDLTFTPTHPPYIYSHQPGMTRLFTGHIDEVGTVTGTLTIDGREHHINAIGGKDHSWGVRDWFAPREWRWIDLVMEPGQHTHPNLTMWRGNFPENPDDWPQEGALYHQDGTVTPLTDYTDQLTTADRNLKPLPRTMTALATSRDTKLRFTGEIIRVLPALFFRDEADEQLIAWNDRALVECTVDDGVKGWANVEIESLVRAPLGSYRKD
ncbi:DUF7065 domain-containing protein [Sciscionella marina]|uniref:DUF7065 domain-containing protein n=1 Tax=Sciscionella marina TaxID=508770 RepID=UPI00037D3991|nr:hypothetical protein [Sciscionella marina]